MITSQDSKAGPYLADGSQRTFPFGFRVLEASHLTVYLDDSPASTDYYVVTLTAAGGSVTFNSAPAAGSRIAIIRDVPATQETDLQDNTAFLPQVLEDAFDKLTMLVQQMKETLTRTLTVPPTREIDTDTLFEEFETLAEHAEEWAKTAEVNCERAIEAMRAAAGSATAASASASNAYSGAASAQSSAAESVSAWHAIQEISDAAELNWVTLGFGSWSVSDWNALIAFNPWSPVSEIAGFPERIEQHNTDPDAHSGVIAGLSSAVAGIRAQGIYPQAAAWSGSSDLNDPAVVLAAHGTRCVWIPSMINGPETSSDFAIISVIAHRSVNSNSELRFASVAWQNCRTGKRFTRTYNNTVWTGWKEDFRPVDYPVEMLRVMAGNRCWVSVDFDVPSTGLITAEHDLGFSGFDAVRAEVLLRFTGVPEDDTSTAGGTIRGFGYTAGEFIPFKIHYGGYVYEPPVFLHTNTVQTVIKDPVRVYRMQAGDTMYQLDTAAKRAYFKIVFRIWY